MALRRPLNVRAKPRPVQDEDPIKAVHGGSVCNPEGGEGARYMASSHAPAICRHSLTGDKRARWVRAN